MSEVAPRGVRGLRPVEPLTPWVAWACLPHLTPSFYGQGLGRPGEPSSPLSEAPSSFGIFSLLWLLVNGVFSFSNQHSSSLSGPRPSGKEPVVWTSWQGSREFAISWIGQGARCGRCPMNPVAIRGQGHAAGKPLQRLSLVQAPSLHSLLGNWVSVFLPKLE